jgi:peroxiredoxin
MYPHERSLVEQLKDEMFALVGVNSDDSPETLAAAMEREKITWPSFFDGGSTGGPIATKWGVTGWPTIYVLDHEGIIRYQGVGGEAMDAAVDELLEKMREQK